MSVSSKASIPRGNYDVAPVGAADMLRTSADDFDFSAVEKATDAEVDKIEKRDSSEKMQRILHEAKAEREKAEATGGKLKRTSSKQQDAKEVAEVERRIKSQLDFDSGDDNDAAARAEKEQSKR